MDHLDAAGHTRGRSRYVDDEPRPAGMLFAAVFYSPVAHGRVVRLDCDAARAAPGVHSVLTAADIPGDNQIGPVIQDESLLAEESVHFQGQPVALVLAETLDLARAARERVVFDVEPLEALVDPKQAFERGEVIGEPQGLETGDVDAAWADCVHVLEGSCDIGGQEHVYLETQRARATPEEGGAMRVAASTQSPYAGQKAIARILELPLHLVEVEVKRLGGGFGGKEDQATAWACLAALGAQLSGRPVELVLRRDDDLLMTGKRHPYLSDWKIGADADGKIVAYDVRHYQSSGAACDLSLAVLGRTVFHSTASYRVPNVRVWGACCRTNIAPMTAFRGFGGPQGMFVIESAIADLADAIGKPRHEIQQLNLLDEADAFPYGQLAEDCRARRTWKEAVADYDLAGVENRVDAWNAEHPRMKKGFALMPVCFGISFTATFMNQAGALVHVYTDGSVAVSTGGIEMGQGLSTNIAIIVARTFGIDAARVRVESTSTRRIANMSPSAASATTLLNGNAALGACRRIQAGLFEMMAEELGCDVAALDMCDEELRRDGVAVGMRWRDMVMKAYVSRIALSAHEFYATPDLWFDNEKRRGRPFAYHVYGTALVEVTVDCLRGTYRMDAVKIVHDLGRSLNERIDIGQVEGGLAQGLGWMTLEDLRYAKDGRLLSKALASYKVPDVDFMPEDLQIKFLENVGNALGPYHSKAVGEPPLMYGIGVFFALRHALRAYRDDRPLAYASPLTPERALMFLHGSRDDSPRRVQG